MIPQITGPSTFDQLELHGVLSGKLVLNHLADEPFGGVVPLDKKTRFSSQCSWMFRTCRIGESKLPRDWPVIEAGRCFD
jgi:hypothetical protein